MTLIELDNQIKECMEEALESIMDAQIELNRAFSAIEEIKKEKPHLWLAYESEGKEDASIH